MDANSCYLGTVGLRELALYSHVVPAFATVVLGIFALLKAPNRKKAELFFVFTLTFAAWLIADLLNWTLNSYNWVAATWSPLDFINIVFFLAMFIFIFYDQFEKYPPPRLTGAIALAALIPFIITISGNSVYEFYQPWCEMDGNTFLAQYKLALEATVLIGILIFGVWKVLITRNNTHERIRVSLMTTAIVFFLGIFGVAEYVSTSTAIFEIMLYTLFVLPVFILLLTIAITQYGTFRLGDSAVRVLFYIFLLLAATQFFYVEDLTEFLLALMSFGVILSLGFLLFRSNQREITFRHELEIANRQQETLLHFISHEIKGYLTKGEAGFAAIVEGDYGKVPNDLSTMAQSGLKELRKGVDTVMDILDASNLKKGTITYDKKTFDFRELVEAVISGMNGRFEEKGLAFDTKIGAGEYTVNGDAAKLRRHVIRNLIDNALRYTPKGTITLELSRADHHIRFAVKDTGVGITPEDMRHLFTEGGKGKDSLKVNVDSTGYGLFVAKSVVEAHGGKIWAESEGKNKGSKFVVELPNA